MKIILNSNIKEKDLIENLLNMHFSGYDDNYIFFFIGLYSLEHRWKYNKLIYYLNLIELIK